MGTTYVATITITYILFRELQQEFVLMILNFQCFHSMVIALDLLTLKSKAKLIMMYKIMNDLPQIVVLPVALRGDIINNYQLKLIIPNYGTYFPYSPDLAIYTYVGQFCTNLLAK